VNSMPNRSPNTVKLTVEVSPQLYSTITDSAGIGGKTTVLKSIALIINNDGTLRLVHRHEIHEHIRG